jgi:PAS domain S-box-containing protein
MAGHSGLSPHLANQRFQLLVNSVTDYAIYMLDREGHVATWNPGARRFKGYEADEIIGRHYSTFFTPEDLEAGLPQLALDTAAREGRFEAEGWRLRKDGTRFWVHAVIDPVRDEAGEVIGFAKITRDVTERRAAERELHESEQRFRLLVQGVRDYAIYMLDPEGVVTNWNAGAEAIKGYKAEEIVGRHFSQFYTEEDRARGEPGRALETALREGKYEREARRVRKDGTEFWASVVIDPIRNEAGEHVGFAKITRDISERIRSEEALEEARSALFQSQKLQALGELTGGIAHDFNNLMTVIRGSAELLRRGGLTEEKRHRYLDAIIDTVDRATTLTSHLLTFGRRQAIRPEVLDLNIRIDALGEVLARTLGSQIEVALNLAPSLWSVEADAAQFESALLNAAINARDAMPEGGRLIIATANCPGPDGEMVCVSVADTGTGMPPEVISRAFEPFFTTKAIGKGTGLGLSQIHGFAAQAGGDAKIESAPGRGTTIRIFLPRTLKPAQDESAAEDAVAAIPKGSVVLIVEDSDQVREFGEHLLDTLHCRVLAAADGEEALRILEREKVDLVFSDVKMPGMSGVELARLVRDRFPALPILLASGYSDEIVTGAASEFEVLHKPYGAQMLATALSKLLQPPARCGSRDIPA